MGLPPDRVPESAEARISRIATDPNYFTAAEQNVRPQIEKKYGEDYFTKNAAEKRDIVAKEMADKYNVYAGHRMQLKSYTPFAPKESQQFKVSGNSVTAGNYQYDVLKHDDGTIETTVKKTKGGKVEPQNFTAEDGEVFEGTFAGQKYDPKQGVDQIKTYVDRTFKNETETPVRYSKITGLKIPKGAKVANPQEVFEVTPHSTRIERVEVPPTNENLGKVKYGGDEGSFWNVVNAKGKSGTTQAGGKKSSSARVLESKSNGGDFTKLSLQDKQSLQQQSGAKTKDEFAKWLKDNNYTF